MRGAVPGGAEGADRGPRHTLNTDGASQGNPGHGGAGAVLRDGSGREVFRLGVYLGRVTNNQAEYQGVILGARRARACGARRLDVVTDSELVVRQLEGRYRVKAPGLASLYLQALEELSGFEDWTVRHVRRELNAEADRMAGDAASLGREGRLPKGGEISGEGPAGGPAGPHDDP